MSKAIRAVEKEQTVASVDNQTENTGKKRKLRAPSTMRSQSALNGEKQAAAALKRPSSFWGGFFYPFNLLWKGLKWLGHLLPFRILGKILFPRYFRNSFRELRLVTWPGRRESWRLTSAVLVFAIVFGAIVAGVDFGLDKLFKELILK